ncbi:MAG: TOBE domain-containing protein, partial [Alphaproteobacteria bacterium]|nr:TOBE domain-containing protein [Alphaproteobacteria bacterium]
KAGEGRVRVANSGIELAAHDMGADFEKGFLVVRPEVVRIGDNAAEMTNKLSGRLFNEYSLGSRIQYQIRMAEGATWVVERLRDERYSGQLDDEVTIGWQPEDAILVAE